MNDFPVNRVILWDRTGIDAPRLLNGAAHAALVLYEDDISGIFANATKLMDAAQSNGNVRNSLSQSLINRRLGCTSLFSDCVGSFDIAACLIDAPMRRLRLSGSAIQVLKSDYCFVSSIVSHNPTDCMVHIPFNMIDCSSRQEDPLPSP